MTEYAADTDGAVICVDCLHGACVSGLPCEAEACECECNRVRELDDRPVDKLTVIAAEFETERRGDLRDLTAERFGATTVAEQTVHIAGFWGRPKRRVLPACGTNTRVPAEPVTTSLAEVTCGTCRRKLSAADVTLAGAVAEYREAGWVITPGGRPDPGTHVGPCARCGGLCVRYGPGGRPLCNDCGRNQG